MSRLSVFGLFSTVLMIVVPAGAAVLVAVLTRSTTRVLAVIGFGIFAFEALLGAVWLLLAPRLISGTDVSVAVLSGTFSVLRTLLAVLGLLLLAFALVTGPSRQLNEGYPGSR